MRVLSCALALIAAALILGACGDDEETTTVTTTAPAPDSPDPSPEEEATGSGEAAAEEIAPPDAKAQDQIDQIAEGIDEEQQRADASGSDPIAGGDGGVPALSYTQAKGNLSRARGHRQRLPRLLWRQAPDGLRGGQHATIYIG